MNALKTAKTEAINEALMISDGNINEAARILGVSRYTVYRYMRSAKKENGDEKINSSCSAEHPSILQLPRCRRLDPDSVTKELLADEVREGRTKLLIVIKHNGGNDE